MTTILTLGFSGIGVIDNTNVLATSGTLNTERNIPYINPYSLPPVTGFGGAASVSKVQYAKGTKYSTGSVSFDVNITAANLLTTNRLFKRGYKFTVRLFDGAKGYSLQNCFATSVSISGSAGGLLTSSMSFSSINEIQQDNSPSTWIREDQPLGYWASGNVNVRDWSLSFTQSVTPIYLNGTGSEFAHYMKIGDIGVTLDVTTFEQIYRHDSIRISASGGLTVTGQSKNEGYSFNGSGDLGTFTHSFESSVAPGGPNSAVILT